MVWKLQSEGLIEGFKVSASEEGVPILQFADDTLLLVSGGLEKAKVVKNALCWFEACSGLHVNASKTKLYKVNIVESWEETIDLWKCAIGSFPDTYLGLPLGAKYKCVVVWEALIDKFRKRLGLWKRRYLSKGGRLVLILSTLQNLPVFMLSSRLAPVSVVEEMEKIIRRFLWGSCTGKRKIHLVSFEGICLPKDLGGLGLKRIREINRSLLCKWFWRLREDRLWVRLLKYKHGTEIGGFMPKKSKLPFGISTWRGLSHVLPLFQCITRWNIGSGDKVSFWLDKWCTKVPLAKLFPVLFAFGTTKNATVAAALGMIANGEIGGCLGQVTFHHQQVAEMTSKLNMVLANYSVSVSDDQLVWEDGTGDLTTANCYTKILQFRLKYFSPGVCLFDWKKVWLKGVPSKVSFCIWLLVRDKILTQNNLQKRGFSLASLCVLCRCANEDIDHLFKGCPLSTQVWDSLTVTNIISVSSTVKERISSWLPKGVSVHGKVLSNLLPHAICWTLWNERNGRIYDEKVTTLQQIICAVKELAWGWYLDSEVKNKLNLERVIFDWHSL